MGHRTVQGRGRVRRSDPSSPGITRRRRGSGYSFTAPDGSAVRDPEERQRLLSLAVPPAWRDVWLCPDPNGHIQAVGYDDAGRKQYIYHPRWHETQARKKFAHLMEIGPALPRARRRVTSILRAADPGEDLAGAVVFRLLDTFGIRIGNEEYADTHGSYGLTTLLVEHVQIEDGRITLDFPGKSDQRIRVDALDRDLAPVLGTMLDCGEDVCAINYPRDGGWSGLTTDQANSFLQDITGTTMTAKDFRTWHATVRGALALARRHDPSASMTRKKRHVNAALDEVAAFLHNTRAMARNSYVDPRLIDRFLDGEVLEARTYRQAERALPAFVE